MYTDRQTQYNTLQDLNFNLVFALTLLTNILFLDFRSKLSSNTHTRREEMTTLGTTSLT
jgi:hypothetical protein